MEFWPHKVRTELGVTDRQMLAAYAILPDGSDRLAADNDGVRLSVGRRRRFEEVVRVRPEPRQLRRSDELDSGVVDGRAEGPAA